MTPRPTAVLDHIAVETVDIDGDVAVMTRTLGLTTVRWGIHVLTGKRIAMLVDRTGMKLEMIETPSPDGSLAHIAFEVADVESAEATAVKAGCLGGVGLIRIPAAAAVATQVRSTAGTAFQFIRYEAGSPDLTDRHLDAPAYRDTEGTAR
jgi:hypothetical protein